MISLRLKWITSNVILSLKIMFKDTLQLKRNNVLKRGFVQDVLTELNFNTKMFNYLVLRRECAFGRRIFTSGGSSGNS